MSKKATNKTFQLEKPIVTMGDADFNFQSSLLPVTDFTTVKHSTNLGDIIASLPAVKKYHEVTGRKISFMQRIDMAAMYYNGAVHPTTDANGTQVCINKTMFQMIKPLLESQEYIHNFVAYDGQKVDLDFDVIRGKTFVNLPHGAIQTWLMYAFPDLAYDISKPWMTLPNIKHPIQKKVKGKVILNFTERYRNTIVDYFFLKNYASDLIFAGTETEHWKFCHQWQLNIPRLEIKDFLEYAYALKACRFLLSNQSFAWNLAQALGVPRVLEVCAFAQNCIAFVGEDSYGFFHQVGLEYYTRMMFNKTSAK
jgi:hypothetical protein